VLSGIVGDVEEREENEMNDRVSSKETNNLTTLKKNNNNETI
jgi:hypothetical protein